MDKSGIIKRSIKRYSGQGGHNILGDGSTISSYPKNTVSNVLKRGWEGIKNTIDEVAPFAVDTQLDKALKKDVERANPYLSEEFKNYIKKIPLDSRAISIRRFNKNPKFRKDYLEDPGVLVGRDSAGNLLKAGAYAGTKQSILNKIISKTPLKKIEIFPQNRKQVIVTGRNDPEVMLHEGSHAFDSRKREILDKSLMDWIVKNEIMTPANVADRVALKRLQGIKKRILSGKLYGGGGQSKMWGLDDATELRAYNISEPGGVSFAKNIYPKSKEMQKQYSGVFDKKVDMNPLLDPLQNLPFMKKAKVKKK